MHGGIVLNPKTLQRIESRGGQGGHYYKNTLPSWIPKIPAIWGDSIFNTNAVGTSYYQEALERIVGGRRDASVYCTVIAMLSKESNNSHDVNAVAVKIDGEVVGHLSQDINLQFRNELEALGVLGDIQCRAMIVGGWSNNENDVGKFGIKLGFIFPIELRRI